MSQTDNLVIMFTDIVGFTERVSSQSRQQNEVMLKQHEKLMLQTAKRFGGKRIKSIGDALLLVFRSPTDALHCAMALHDALWEQNQPLPEEERLAIRVALSSGDVRLSGGDVIGEPVIVASRIEDMTPANEIYFSEAIYLAMNKAEVLHELVGEFELKGIPDNVSVYRVPRSATVKRLVVVSSDEEADFQYPYGGAHHQGKGRLGLLSRLPLKSIAASLAAIALIASLALFWPERGPDDQELQQLLEDNNLVLLEEKLTVILSDNPEDSSALFMLGHINVERRNYKDGLEFYGKALSRQPELAEDERYAANVTRLMGSNGAKVTELAKLSPSEQLVEKLLDRSVQPGISGRRDATYILSEINRASEIDSAAIAILDFEESKTCDEKLEAIRVIKDKKDQRALPVLKEALKGGVVSRFKKGCYIKQVKEAISAIEG